MSLSRLEVQDKNLLFHEIFFVDSLFVLLVKGAVSRNSAKLGNYKMPVKLRET